MLPHERVRLRLQRPALLGDQGAAHAGVVELLLRGAAAPAREVLTVEERREADGRLRAAVGGERIILVHELDAHVARAGGEPPAPVESGQPALRLLLQDAVRDDRHRVLELPHLREQPTRAETLAAVLERLRRRLFVANHVVVARCRSRHAAAIHVREALGVRFRAVRETAASPDQQRRRRGENDVKVFHLVSPG